MDCMNLQEQFGTRYRVTFDAAYNPKHVPRDKLDPCMMQMPCERGTVYPHGGDLLAVEVKGTPGRCCSQRLCRGWWCGGEAGERTARDVRRDRVGQ